MYCGKCGTNNQDGWVYCCKCGAELPRTEVNNGYEGKSQNNYNQYDQQYRNGNQNHYQNQYQYQNQYGNQYGNQYQNQNPYQNPYQYNSNPVPAMPDKGKSIASMVLGILSIVLCGLIGVVCAIIALALGMPVWNDAKSQGIKNNFVTAGVVCGWVGLSVSIVWLFIWVIGMLL